VCASLFGNVFLVSDEGCWYLDIVEGAISRAWPDLDEMRSSLASAEARDRYLLEGLVHAATDRGLTLGEASIYDFTVAPVLGGSLAMENVSVTDFVVGVNIAGQIHDQVRHMRPGTNVSGVTVDAGAPTKRRGLWTRKG
jgi:hypothetical protein